MKTKLTFIAVILSIGFFFVSNAQTMNDKPKNPETEALAQKIVNQCAHIQEGKFVMITGWVRDLELLEDITINVRKLGAFPLLTMGSERITRRMYTDVPEKYDTQVPENELKLLNIVDAIISVDYNEMQGLMADIPVERFLKKVKANEPVNDLIAKRNIKGVNLGNGLYPTEANAKQYGLTQKELSDIFWKGVNVDYAKLEATGKSVQTVLAAGKEVQITNPNGTDLKVRIENRPVIVSDGVLSKEDLEKGFASSQVYLPAGEAYVAPVPGTAEGTVVVDHTFYQGKDITGLTLTFKAGKLTSMTAKSGLEPLKELYDVAEPGKDEFSFIDLCLNPNVQLKPGSKLVAWMPAGMVTVGIGNNVWAGGENKTAYSLSSYLPGSTLKVDGRVLIENGMLKN